MIFHWDYQGSEYSTTITYRMWGPWRSLSVIYVQTIDILQLCLTANTTTSTPSVSTERGAIFDPPLQALVIVLPECSSAATGEAASAQPISNHVPSAALQTPLRWHPLWDVCFAACDPGRSGRGQVPCAPQEDSRVPSRSWRDLGSPRPSALSDKGRLHCRRGNHSARCQYPHRRLRRRRKHCLEIT